MGDRLAIESGKVVVNTEEGVRLERPESDLDAMYQEELTAPLNGTALPDGVKFAEWRRPFFLVVHQLPPLVRQLQWIANDSPSDFGPGTKYRKVRLSVPYGITFALYVKHGPQLHLTGTNELYFRNEPLRTKQDKLGYPALLNISTIKTPQRIRCWICTQHLARKPGEDWTAQLRQLIEHTWNGAFNRSSERHEGQSSYGFSQGVHPHLHPVEKWEKASTDETFALHVPWKPVPLCVGELMERLFLEAAAQPMLPGRLGPVATAGVAARFVGFAQRSQAQAKKE